MNKSRLPFTLAQSFRAISSDAPLAVRPEHAVNDTEICIICGALAIFAAAAFGAILGFYL